MQSVQEIQKLQLLRVLLFNKLLNYTPGVEFPLSTQEYNPNRSKVTPLQMKAIISGSH